MGIRRTALLLASVALAMILVGWGAGRAEVAQADSRPNIIFVMTDDQDKDTIRHMPFVHNTMIPNGMTFPNATFNFPLCCPSRASILRGQYAHNHNVWENTADQGGGYEKFLANDLDDSNFPIWLDETGYNVGGFGLYVNQYDPAVHGTPAGFDFYRHHTRDWNNQRIPSTEHRDRYVKDNAVRWLKENVSGGPLMMWVSFHAPHAPFRYDPIYEGKFTNAVLPRGPAFNEADVSDKPEYVRNLPRLTEEQIAQLEKNHRDRLRANLTPDDALRELRDAVRAAGELSNTYIVFWTDNGWMMGEHRLGSGKRVPYVESGSFPMVIRGPGVSKGATDKRVVMNQDLAPTFLELAGASTPDFVDGRSMVPILGGEGSWRDVGLIEAPPPIYPYQPPAYEGLRAQDYVYVEYATGEREYYDLVADPHQLNNGYKSLTDQRKAELSARLDALRRCTGSLCREAEEVDVTPPQTTILNTGTGAVSVTNSTDASFSFDSSEADSTFECSLNSGTSYSSCTSPKTYTGLVANRQHVFRVRAIDKSGNVDPTPATHAWTIDTIAPDRPVIDAPKENAGVTGSFAVSGTAERNSTVKLLEGTTARGTTTADASGNWSISLTGVAEGSHTYTARATDAAGNTSQASSSRTVIVDTTPPRVESVVPARNAKGVNPVANVEAFFSEAMKKSSINTNTVKLFKAGSTTPVSATVDYDAAARKAILDPGKPLVRGKRYKAVVTNKARDVAGNRLDQNLTLGGLQPKKWYFTVKH